MILPELRPAATGIGMYPSGDPRYAIEIQRSPNGSTGWVSVAVLPPGSAQSYIDAQPLDGVARYYQARSVELVDGGIVRTGPWFPSTPTNGKPKQLSSLSAPAIQAAKLATQPSTDTSSRYQCYATQAGASQATGTTILGLNAEYVDVGNLHDTVTNNSRITIPAVNYLGVWLFFLKAGFAANAAGQRSILLYKNGSPFSTGPSRSGVTAGGVETLSHADFDVNPNPGDYYEMAVFQNTGGNLTISGAFGAVHAW